MDREQFLDGFEKTLEAGLVKVCQGAGVLKADIVSNPDFDEVWDAYIKDYIADAVDNFNEYPEAAIAWAAFLGMGVANNWDADWAAHSKDAYTSYYGPHGWDDLDEHVLYEMLHLKKDYAAKLSDTMDSCALATLGLIRHEAIETQTANGFFVLSRVYSVMFRLGVSIELERLGYKKVLVNPSDILQ